MNENTHIKKKIMVERRFSRDGTPKRDDIRIFICDDVQSGMKYEELREKYELKNATNVIRIVNDQN